MNRITIECLRALCHDLNHIEITPHCFARFRERGITLNDILYAIQNGGIIEQYPDDYPFPSCLVFGLSPKNTYLHAVCGVGDNKIWLITAYFPDSEKWEDDYTTRKAVQ